MSASGAGGGGRRQEDQTPRLFLASCPAAVPEEQSRSVAVGALEIFPCEGGDARDEPAGSGDGEGAALLLELRGEDAILVAGIATRRIPRGDGGKELISRAAAGAAVWRREWLRERRRLHLAEQIIAFGEQLNAAERVEEVYGALLRNAVGIVGGYHAFLFLRGRQSPLLHPFETARTPVRVARMELTPHPSLYRPGIIRAADASADTGSPYASVAPLFTETGAVMLAHVPFGEEGILFLAERRQDRLFEPEDWELLRTLTGQARVALERMRMLEEIRELSLTDPLTGLANRRRMQIVLEHSLAAARRGEPLSLVMLDLDNFKEINDRQGHLEGDRILIRVAQCLREQVRGSDLAVRYGGDEFLLILPGGDAEGAAVLVGRVRAQLAGEVELSVGMAEYDPALRSAEELIEAADRRLYAAKRRRQSRAAAVAPEGG